MTRTQRRTRRPDRQSPGSVWLSTIFKGWDFWASVVIGGAIAGISLGTGELDGGSGYYWPFVPLGFGAATGIWGVERWLAGRLRSSDYGELIGIADPDNHAAMVPYFVVEVVGFFTGVFAIVAALVIDGLDEITPVAAIQGILGWLASWTVLGLLSLFVMTHKHIRREAAIENMKRAFEADQREKQSREDPQNSG